MDYDIRNYDRPDPVLDIDYTDAELARHDRVIEHRLDDARDRAERGGW